MAHHIYETWTKRMGQILMKRQITKHLIYLVLKDNFTTQENCNTIDFWKMIYQSAINHSSKIAIDHTLASRQIPIYLKDQQNI